MKVAICQMIVVSSLEQNFNRMKKFVECAASKKCDLVVFPESCLTGYLGMSIKNLEDINIDELDKYLCEISNLAKDNNISIVSGQYLKRCGKWFNNVIFWGKDGRFKGSYDKSHLIDADCYHVTAGEAPIVFEYEGVKYVLGVCHDIRYPEHAMYGAINGAQIYINPFYGFRGLDTYKDVQKVYNSTLVSRAVENGMFIISPNAANNEQMVRSQVVSPRGDVIIMAPDKNEEIFICDIDPSIAGNGWVKRRRSDLYEFKCNLPQRLNYFEKSYWQKEYYNINHDSRLVNLSDVKEKEF